MLNLAVLIESKEYVEVTCWLNNLFLFFSVVFFCSMTVAMKSQARWDVMDRPEFFYTGGALMGLGTLLVVSSFLALGFTGTFLGGYLRTGS